jgi:O-succinylhomoserine sulfhydrylase
MKRTNSVTSAVNTKNIMENKQFETQAIRAQLERTDYNEHSAPLFLTSSFVFDTAEEMRAAFNEESDDFIYSRYVNPNTSEFINKVCLLEGAEAGFATATGMAAIFTTFMSIFKIRRSCRVLFFCFWCDARRVYKVFS